MKPKVFIPGHLTLAPYACHPSHSRGRLFKEKESATRTPFQRDRDRIIHSTSFRRLEYKTQVFVNHEGDHYRTRLTHSLEVSQLARTMCRTLGLNEDLAETIALAHDLGHTPFGHAGEDGLGEAMREFGGFDHNAQTIRVLTRLEHRYAQFDGLNLSWETLEGIAKHNGPLTTKGKKAKLPRALAEYVTKHDLELGTYASLEAQVASLADDIAYYSHDIEDGLRAKLFTIDDLLPLPMVGKTFLQVRKEFPTCDAGIMTYEAIRRIMEMMIGDLYTETNANIQNAKVGSVGEVRALGRPLAAFSKEMQAHQKTLRAFLMQNMYRHYKVNRMTSKARRVVKEMFSFLLREPECLPTDWQARIDTPGSQQAAEVVADFIAGMTDRYALDTHKRLFDLSSQI